MKYDAADDERSEQWAGTAHSWAVKFGSETMASAQVPPFGNNGTSEVRRSRYSRMLPMPLSIRVDDANVDEHCRKTLRRLVAAGCLHANIPYSLEQFQVAEKDLQYLGKHGLVHARASALLQPVLLSYELQKTGADVGKITVILNVNLA